jgi:hypothetical protein
MLQYSIGDARFLDMSGMPDFVKLALEVIERPGIDGAAFLDYGYRGREFNVRTKVDCIDYPAAVECFADYCTLVGGDPLNVFYMGQSLLRFNVKFQVLDVRAVTVCQMAGGIGGLHPPSQGLCEADWTLKCVPLA